jgi:hypothetical protein
LKLKQIIFLHSKYYNNIIFLNNLLSVYLIMIKSFINSILSLTMGHHFLAYRSLLTGQGNLDFNHQSHLTGQSGCTFTGPIEQDYPASFNFFLTLPVPRFCSFLFLFLEVINFCLIWLLLKKLIKLNFFLN